MSSPSSGTIHHYTNDFTALNQQQVYRYINFHRPCYFPSIVADKEGKERKRYRYEDMMTPYVKFCSVQKPAL
ncbi:MAG: hypothetical protein IH836_03590 [Proteobacteria bacterium]|nr:hypothetical protein [Pseudomonadota bacterium]